MTENDSEVVGSMEAAVVRALERRPEIAIPENFAANVIRLLPAEGHSNSAFRPIYGHMAGYISVVLTMMLLAVLTRSHPKAIEAGQGFLLAIEMLLVAQLLAVGYWLGMKSGDS